MWYFGTKKIDGREYQKQVRVEQYYVCFSDEERFINDKVFINNDKCLLILDGIIFNKNELEIKHKNWNECCLELINKTNFPDMLRGSFSGIYFNRSSGLILFFTNHSGERQVFYYKENKDFIVTTNYNHFRELKFNNFLKLELNEKALRYLMTYGFMIEDCTVYHKVKRLIAGKCGYLVNNNFSTKWYHRFTNSKTVNLSEDKIIEKLDKLFRNAIRLEFTKDLEYGLAHIIDLSGGLDCRIVNYVAKDMGYKNVLNISYSQVGSNEYKAMMNISKDLDNELIFYPLDSAEFIFDVDKITNINYGLCIYATSTGLSKILSVVNRQQYGIEHGGLMGDLRDGAFPGNNYYRRTPAKISQGMRFSRICKLPIETNTIETQYEDQEQFDIYTRGFLGGLSTQMIRRQYGEYFAPYMDPDFYDFFLSIPLNQRVGGKILQKWINKCYPDAFKLVDDKYMCKINANKVILNICKVRTKIENRVNNLAMKKNWFYRQNSMNPFNYWYATKSKVKNFINMYYEANREGLNSFKELQADVDLLFLKGNAREKTMALSVLSVVKLYGKNVEGN